MAIDTNAITFKYRTRASQAVTELVVALVQKGIDVIVLFDGPERHDSKRAAIQRRAAKAKGQVQLLEL